MQVFGIVPAWRLVIMATGRCVGPSPLTAIANSGSPVGRGGSAIAASTNAGTLATLTSDGDPWASFVTYGLLGGGRCCACPTWPSTAATSASRAPASRSWHRNARRPLASGRITLAGVVEEPAGGQRAAAVAHLAAVAAAKYYIDYSGFSLWVLQVRRVRWVGGYGRMDSATGEASPPPSQTSPRSDGAIAHLNGDHADALVAMAQAIGGYPDTTAATCTGADRYGLDLRVVTPRGVAYTRIGYATPIDSIDELRSATDDLTRRARHA
jgi:putative heme iron utilization protein